MNRKYAKPLFALIESEFRGRWPEFTKCKGGPPGGRAFRRLIEGGGAVFVFIFPDQKGYERLFCEFAWSPSEHPPPDRSGHGFPLETPKAAFEQPVMVAGIQRLWGDNGVGAWQVPDPVETFDPLQHASDPEAAGKEFMRRLNLRNSLTDADAQALVAPLVDQLMEKLQSVVMPYLEDYVTVARSKASGG